PATNHMEIVRPVKKENSFDVYPNPAKEIIHIDLVKNSLIRIIDMKGVVKYQDYHNKGKTEISNRLLPGIYLIQAIGDSDEGMYTKRIVVE
ncbi:MAG: T9SS type A sorting domain-containing protein, partial [Bacteroidales bacterium]|nr:T9SS type A sorting domain-containing protein [Bacteroidales bacterium]